jgi:hypothetical protein
MARSLRRGRRELMMTGRDDRTQGSGEPEVVIEHGVERSPALPGMGALIGIGAGFGMVLGVILGDLVMGMLAGAAVGTVAGAVVEMRRKRGASD